MKKMTEDRARKLLQEYFRSRRVEKRDQEGNFVIAKTGEILFEERPCTVTGIALALGMRSREELLEIKDKKIKALVDRALLRVEENAEEKLFYKDTAAGAKLFLSVNFQRWGDPGAQQENAPPTLGVCSVWAE